MTAKERAIEALSQPRLRELYQGYHGGTLRDALEAAILAAEREAADKARLEEHQAQAAEITRLREALRTAMIYGLPPHDVSGRAQWERAVRAFSPEKPT